MPVHPGGNSLAQPSNPGESWRAAAGPGAFMALCFGRTAEFVQGEDPVHALVARQPRWQEAIYQWVTMFIKGHRPPFQPLLTQTGIQAKGADKQVDLFPPEFLHRQAPAFLVDRLAIEQRRKHLDKNEIRPEPILEQPGQIQQVRQRTGARDAKIKGRGRLTEASS